MLGSFQDAEDALQDTQLAAWRGLAGFEGRASMRTPPRSTQRRRAVSRSMCDSFSGLRTA